MLGLARSGQSAKRERVFFAENNLRVVRSVWRQQGTSVDFCWLSFVCEFAIFHTQLQICQELRRAQCVVSDVMRCCSVVRCGHESRFRDMAVAQFLFHLVVVG